ncbi:MAG: glycerol kinase [Spirochaetes bacterium]|nr:glycerol kinase [Spirochaetota bacterium]
MSGYILGIDIGTTGIKAIIVDRESNIQGSGSREISLVFPHPDWVEQDPDVIWNLLLDTVQEALSVSKVDKGKIEAVGISHQGESVVAWDPETGTPYYNNIVWQDRRTADRCDKIGEKLSAEITEKTGLNIDPVFSSTKIEWLLRNVPEIRAGLPKGRVRASTLDTWVVWRLTGGAGFFTDYTSASRTMLFNLRTKQWDDALLREFSIPREILADPKPSSYYFGTTDPKIFLGIEAPITGIVVDQQGAIFGQACFEKGDSKTTYGTSCGIYLITGDEITSSKNGMTVTIALGLENKITYAEEGAVYITGAAIQWLRDGLGIIDSASDIEKLAVSVKNTMGVYFVPTFVGVTAPYWDYRTRGTIIGLTRAVTKAHLARATLESIAYQVRDMIGMMEDDTGLKVSRMKADGGAVRNAFLMQFQADILGIPVIVPEVTETTCLGTAFIAGLKVGFWKSLEEVQSVWKIHKTYEPSMAESEREELYSGWSNALKKTIEVYT